MLVDSANVGVLTNPSNPSSINKYCSLVEGYSDNQSVIETGDMKDKLNGFGWNDLLL